MTAKPRASVAPDDARHQCAFCGRRFTRETALVAHHCEPHRRFLARGDKDVKNGMMAYTRFKFRKMGAQKAPEWPEFEGSQFYAAFVRFGRWLDDINAVNPLAFVDFLLRYEVRLDDWCKADAYELYMRELAKTETPDAAIERNFLLMRQWSMETGEDWIDFFRKVASTRLTQWIVAGRVSPWVFLIAPSGVESFERLTSEQQEMVTKAVEPDFWSRRLDECRADVEHIRLVLTEAGL